METLAVIMARGGSKGLPRKNLALLGGRPLVTWTIAAAQGARRLGRTIVSTEDAEIAAVAKAHGAEVPFMRPAELALDTTSGTAPSVHALRWLEEHEGYVPDLVLCLQPPSPFRTSDDIDASIALLIERGADSVIGVTDADPHPYWTRKANAEGWLEPFVPGEPITRRQALPKAYALNGAICLATRSLLLDRDTFYGDRTASYWMPAERSIDIDTPWDLHVANLLVKDLAPFDPKS